MDETLPKRRVPRQKFKLESAISTDRGVHAASAAFTSPPKDVVAKRKL